MARLARTLQVTLLEMIGAQAAEGAIPAPRDRRVIRQ
jgi:hypothetical protein